MPEVVVPGSTEVEDSEELPGEVGVTDLGGVGGVSEKIMGGGRGLWVGHSLGVTRLPPPLFWGLDSGKKSNKTLFEKVKKWYLTVKVLSRYLIFTKYNEEYRIS